MTTPQDRKYTAEHLWLKPESDGTYTAGITAHAQEELGDIVYVQPPASGQRVSRGEACGVIESVKTASDLHAPVSGEVAAVNGEIDEHPERVNADPYGTWLFRLRAADPAQIEALLDAASYDRLVVQGGT